MDNKNNQSQQFFNEQNNWKSLGFFSAEDYLIYVFKKTEKITAAIYLVSGLLKDNEPMKWELRDKGMDMMSSSFSASSSIPGDKNAIIQSLFSAALETISLLNVAKISHLISDMNHALLVKEIDNVIALMKDRLISSAESAGYVLSEKFFKTPDLFTTGFKSDGGRSADLDRRSDHSGTSGDKPENAHSNSRILQGQPDVRVKKSQRQEDIIVLLKGQSNLTIKDFSKVIRDCSEKTIQRELLELVDKGVIKKEGERRWSRYSLMQK
ncbi:MAG: hypothetical protein NTZ38_02600 [Candidatus Taylorbacteria bacterium]|nr:hypothetical protein [Candidatus Taylorbacteria bacterium]